LKVRLLKVKTRRKNLSVNANSANASLKLINLLKKDKIRKVLKNPKKLLSQREKDRTGQKQLVTTLTTKNRRIPSKTTKNVVIVSSTINVLIVSKTINVVIVSKTTISVVIVSSTINVLIVSKTTISVVIVSKTTIKSVSLLTVLISRLSTLLTKLREITSLSIKNIWTQRGAATG